MSDTGKELTTGTIWPVYQPGPQDPRQSPHQSRFDKEQEKNNLLDRAYNRDKKARETAKAVRHLHGKKVKKPAKLAGVVPRDSMFDLEMEFSEDGETYGNPLVNPLPNTEYYVRLRIRQHQADPLLQGFSVLWRKPSGWGWVDGVGSTTHDEAISNPLVIARVVQTPGSLGSGVTYAFKTVVSERFLL